MIILSFYLTFFSYSLLLSLASFSLILLILLIPIIPNSALTPAEPSDRVRPASSEGGNSSQYTNNGVLVRPLRDTYLPIYLYYTLR